MNIFVANISFKANEDDIKGAFEPYGEVKLVKLITDHETGKPKGYGFVEMPNDEEAEKAISELDGAELDGRTLKVNKARPRPEKARRGR